jgi:hypothetical protein
MATSFLFNSTNGLDMYRNDSVIQGLLGSNFVLLNLAEFLDWYMPDPSRTTPHRAAAAKTPYAPTLMRRQVSYDDKTIVARDVLPRLASICQDISEGYGQYAVQSLLDRSNQFDLLVALHADYNDVDRLGKTTTVSERKINKIAAFIIVELGECKKKPKTVSVNLICGKNIQLYPRGVPVFKAAILLGAYLYCIKNSNLDQEGILELANGYTNAAGFMTYTKLGFNYDKNLHGDNCFADFINLPMSVNLVKMTPETIINLVGDVTERRIDNIDDPTMLYKLKPYKNTKANELILLQNISNILYRLELGTVNGKSAISHYTNKTPSTNIYLNPIEKQLINEYMTNLSSVSGKINVQTLTNFMNDKKDRVIEAIGVNCKDGTCSSTIRCINGICNFLGKPDAFGGKHKTRRHKTRKYKTRKHKTRKHKRRK